MKRIEYKRKCKISKSGVVISNKMEKTVVVRVDRKLKHSIYNKLIKKSQKYYAHDETNSIAVGTNVTIVEARPLSKMKRWKVVNSS